MNRYVRGADEDSVRSKWNIHYADWDARFMPFKFCIRIAVPDLLSSSSRPGIDIIRDTEAEAWAAACEFTEEREAEIWEVEDEVKLIRVQVAKSKILAGGEEGWALDAWERIFDHAQKRLDQLKLGWIG